MGSNGRRWRCRRIAAALGVCIALACGAGAEAARVLYASATAQPGNPAANGTLFQPYALSSAIAALQSGDTLYLLPGKYRMGGFTPSGLTDVTIATAPGSASRAEIRGDVPVPPGAWSLVAPDIYATPVASRPVGAVWNWDTNLTTVSPADAALGRVARNFGHLREAPTADLLSAVPGSWLWSEGTLFVHKPKQGQAPDAGDVYAWLRPGVAFQPFNCDGLTFRDLDFALWTEFENNAGYSVKLTNCVRSTIEDSLSRDSGWHAYGAVGYPNRDNALRNLESRGQTTDGVRTSNPFVFANTIRFSGPTEGFVGESLTHHAYGLLDCNGSALVPGYSGLSLLSHGALGSTIRDVRWSDIVVMTYDAEPRCLLVSAGDSPAPTSDFDPAAYPVRVWDATIRSANPKVGGPVAVERTAFDIRPGRIWSVGAPVAMTVDRATTLLAACTIVFDMSHAPFGRLFRVEQQGRLILDHTSMYSITLSEHGGSGSTALDRGQFAVIEDDSASLTARGSVFVRDQQAPFFRDLSSRGDAISLRGCWYARLPDEESSGADSVGDIRPADTLVGESPASFDPEGVFNATTGMVAPQEGDFSAPPGAPIRSIRRVGASPAIPTGINGVAFGGNFGAVQYGPSGCLPDRTGDGVVDGADLGVLLAAWNLRDATVDLTGDAYIDGADLGALLSSWGPCAE
jgi:hypothetical protein